MAGRRQMDSLWKKYFSDPSHWWDNRSNKRHSKSPDFRHKTTQELLWIDGWYNSSWVREELSRRGMLISNTDVTHGESCLENVAKAQHVDGLPVREVVAWNALIAGYAQQGQGMKALDCYERMRSEGLSPNAITYACILKACGITREADRGKQVHDDIINKGLLGKDVVLGTALVGMYVKCGAIAKAALVLDQMSVRDVVSWNALIAGYNQQGQGKEALDCYERMRSEGFAPDAITYTCILKACGITREANSGKQLHDEIVSQGLLERGDVVLGNALVDMYAKCGAIAKAQQVLDKLPIRDTASWHSLIAGYAQQGQGGKVLDCYERMRSEGLVPHPITYPCILKACGITQEADRGKQIHDEIVSRRLLGKDVVLW